MWCDLDPFDDWGIPEYSRDSARNLPIFQHRAKHDANPPSIYDAKLGNRVIEFNGVSCTKIHCRLLLNMLNRHVDNVRSICNNLKQAENKLFLDEVLFMLRAIWSSVRQFVHETCYEHVKKYVAASLLRFNPESIFFTCYHCYSHCADILRFLWVLQEHMCNFEDNTLEKLMPLASRWSGITYTLCKFHKCL